MGAMLRVMLTAAVACKVLAVGLWIFTSAHWIAIAGFFAPDFFVLYQLLAPSSQGICRVFTHFETTRPEIWLTIDDGPDAQDTPRILDLLDRHRARATFFVIGERAERAPALVAEILRRGHEVGHHTQTHPLRTFWCATPSRVRAELDEGFATLAAAAAGTRPRWFRAPAGIKGFFLAPALAERGLQCVGWNVRSLDSISRDPARVLARVKPRLQPGAIVLMHEGPSLDPRVRVRALELVLDELAARGLACVLPAPEQLR
jgi:peptidoglycan/xylan/chitin deacetylase (PgdA/CDA1 family)